MRRGKFPIRVAAEITGISHDRLRAWERRYGAIRPKRGARGREFTNDDVQRILLLRECLRCGHSIGRIANLTNRQLRGLIQPGRQAVEVSPPDPAEGEDKELLGAVLEAIQQFDCMLAERELTKAAVLLGSHRRLVYRVVLPLMRAVGLRWGEGRLTIAQEHMVTVILTTVLGGLLHMNAPAGHAARLLLATPPEERHTFGTLAAGLVAATGGLGVICLGGDLPTDEIVMSAKKSRADIVVVAVYGSWPRNRFGELDILERELPRKTELWLGGPIALTLKKTMHLARTVPLPDFHRLEENLVRRGAHFQEQTAGSKGS